MIPIEREPAELRETDDLERCVFCRKGTSFWTDLEDRSKGDQVACCESCAARAYPADVPSKAVWFRREKLSSPYRGEPPVKAPTPLETATYPQRRRAKGSTTPIQADE